MNRSNLLLGMILGALSLAAAGAGPADDIMTGERLDASAYGPGVIETMDAVIERERIARETPRAPDATKVGRWAVPKRGAITAPRSGDRYIANQFGDTRMVFSFSEPVDFRGFWVANQATATVSAPGIKAAGYRDGVLVGESEWYCQIGDRPTWFAADLRNIDSVEILAIPALNGVSFYGVDDLSYVVRSSGREVTLGFDDLDYGTDLTNSNYGGVLWEPGYGDYPTEQIIHAPEIPPGAETATGGRDGDDDGSGTRAVLPSLLGTVQSTIRGDAGQFSSPPDTCGAIGPNHLVSVVNTNFQVYDPNTGLRLVNTSLSSFQPGTSGDPRVLFDQYSQRWIVVSTNFGSNMYVAVSLTNDPTGAWFKTFFNAAQGTDAGKWIDFPTLGYDQTRVYIGAFLVGGSNQHSLFVLDKAALLASNPNYTVTAFRGLAWEGSLQPCIHYGATTTGYIVSRVGGGGIRVRRVEGSATSPTLTTSGSVIGVPAWSSPGDAPALGASTNIDAGDDRLVVAVFRNNYIYTSHTVSSSGRGAARWYQLQANPPSLVQSGTVTSPTLHYYYPSLMVNASGAIVMGFSGSDANTRPSAYYTGRAVTDPSGQMATPVLLRAGVGSYALIDGFGRNRWGDYSLTTLDPDNEVEFWSLQEYVHANQTWGTVYARLTLGGDCNNNGIPDFQDVANGTSQDCNDNNNPDECDLSGGISQDCNSNQIPDECDIANGTVVDCNGNIIPDACEVGSGAAPDCNNNGIPDECDINSGFSIDCNNNGVPDSCDVGSGAFPDCNANGVPDLCDLASGTPDCNGNNVPDSCDLVSGFSISCNGNNIPDECDITSGNGDDCNGNRVIDSCENDATPGLAGAYFNSATLTGTPRGRIDSTVNFNFGTGPAWPNQNSDNFSIRWTGFLKTLSAGNGSYSFFVTANDGVRLRVNGQLIIDQWSAQAVSERVGVISLTSNKIYAISLEYFATTGAAEVKLSWQPPGGSKVVVPAANLIPGRDCNGNGQNDLCDFVGTFNNVSPTYSPLGTGFPQTHVIVAPPAAASDVTMQFTAFGDLNTANETVAVSINGTSVGTVFVTGGLDCAETSQSLVIPQATYNAAKGAGDVSILMTASASVNPTQCSPVTYIRVSTTYTRILSLDENGNLIPDECESAPTLCPGDMDCNGEVNFFDIDPFVLALSGETGYLAQFPNCQWLNGDTDGDQDVDFFDIDPFVNLLGTPCP